jgi:hypothetical protein
VFEVIDLAGKNALLAGILSNFFTAGNELSLKALSNQVFTLMA